MMAPQMLRSSTDLRVRERHGARVTDHERAGGREPGASSVLAASARAPVGWGAVRRGMQDRIKNSSGRCSRRLPTTLMAVGAAGAPERAIEGWYTYMEICSPQKNLYGNMYNSSVLAKGSAIARGRQLGRWSVMTERERPHKGYGLFGTHLLH
jgi:hypothetical protein